MKTTESYRIIPERKEDGTLWFRLYDNKDTLIAENSSVRVLDKLCDERQYFPCEKRYHLGLDAESERMDFERNTRKAKRK